MPQAREIVVCGAGFKGATFVEGLLQKGITISSIATYPQRGDLARGFERLRELATDRSIKLLETSHPTLAPENLIFVVGWQYLLPAVTPATVVFHDSLLPRYRGFAPTVTALIKGDSEIGVTALQPIDAIDQGPIIAQRALSISYPIKIETAFKLQTSLMSDIAVEIVDSWRRGQFSAVPQNEELASYSIWRDDQDYEINWSESAAALERFVNAVGYPYAGARTTVDGAETIRISEVTVMPDLAFEIRDAGKIWRLDNGRPVVICGTGMLRIDNCHRGDGSSFTFQRLRSRLRPRKLAVGRESTEITLTRE